MAMEHKSLNPLEMGLQVKVLDESQGIVDAIVSVTNVKDHVNDMVMPGAYKDTLEARKPKVCWGHDWKTPVGKTLEIVELMPGDPRLPLKLLQMNAGALQAKVQFNLNTTRGREAFEDVKFWQEEGEWSIGYDAKGQGGKAIRNPNTGVREIHKMALFEMSPVLFGAAPHTSTLAVKSASVMVNTEMKVALHRPQIKVTDVVVEDLDDDMTDEDILELTDDEAQEILDDMVAEGLIEKSLVDYYELKNYDPQVALLELDAKLFGKKPRDGDGDGVIEGRRGNGRRGVRDWPAGSTGRRARLSRRASDLRLMAARVYGKNTPTFHALNNTLGEIELNAVRGDQTDIEGMEMALGTIEQALHPDARKAGVLVGAKSRDGDHDGVINEGRHGNGRRGVSMHERASVSHHRAVDRATRRSHIARYDGSANTGKLEGVIFTATNGDAFVVTGAEKRELLAKHPKKIKQPKIVNRTNERDGVTFRVVGGKGFDDSVAEYMELKAGYALNPIKGNHNCKGKGCKVCAMAKVKAQAKAFDEILEAKGSQIGAARAAISRREGSRFIGTSKLGDIRIASNAPIDVSLEGKSRDGDGDGVANEGRHGNGRRGVSHRATRRSAQWGKPLTDQDIMELSGSVPGASSSRVDLEGNRVRVDARMRYLTATPSHQRGIEKAGRSAVRQAHLDRYKGRDRDGTLRGATLITPDGMTIRLTHEEEAELTERRIRQVTRKGSREGLPKNAKDLLEDYLMELKAFDKKPRDGDGDGVIEGRHGNGRRGTSHRATRKDPVNPLFGSHHVDPIPPKNRVTFDGVTHPQADDDKTPLFHLKKKPDAVAKGLARQQMLSHLRKRQAANAKMAK